MLSTIIRFDHISKVISRDLEVDDSYKFKELKIKNTAGRFDFMDVPFRDIDMYYYDRKLPVEVVAYDTVEKFTGVTIDGNSIHCRVYQSSLSDVFEVFREIGFKEQNRTEQSLNNHLWDISGTLDKSKVYFEVEAAENISTLPINWGGYNCPCFLVKDVYSTFERLKDKRNVKVSSIDSLLVNNRALDVGFMGILGFELAFEFISIRRNSRR